MPSRTTLLAGLQVAVFCLLSASSRPAHAEHAHNHDDHVDFSIQSVTSGEWSDAKTWEPARVPKQGDRVLISGETFVTYDVKSPEVIRMVQVVGTLSFARDRDTELNVGLLKVQNSDVCSENGFACDFHDANDAGEPTGLPGGRPAALLVGTPDQPIPAEHTASIRLHYLKGMNRDDAPAIACCSARMEIHGTPMNRTWVKLGADVEAGAATVITAERVSGWRVGDDVIVTASQRTSRGRTFRNNPQAVHTEQRRIAKIEGDRITLDRPLDEAHSGSGEFRSEIANLSRNVTIESADPDGVRGHTVYHRFSEGGISYARLAHLGKEGVLGRYAVHFHVVGDTMRGSSVRGVAVVDSHNRWITIHGTHYLVVRDCVGYGSVGHGYFLEDGTEVYNLLDRNLGVHAYKGRPLPDQVLSFDPNDGAAFWWANGRNTLTRNVTCENDEYGYRYDMQHTSRFDSSLPILQPNGEIETVDVRTIPIWRFEDNEAHAEGFYGMLVAANGNSQPDNAIRDEKMLARIKRVDWTGPDTRHPHVIRNLKIWGSHYAFRPHSPAMLIENVRIHEAAYGIYRPAFENQVYRNLHISSVGAEPFNRGMDDASAQTGKISVDGLTFATGYGNRSTPLVQISDVNISGDAETHFRNVTVNRPAQFQDRWPLINRGVGPRVPPITKGVPIYIHDHFGPGRHAKVISVAAKDLAADGNDYKALPPLTGDESRVAEVNEAQWPELLDPVDDVPPATIITSVQQAGGKVIVRGVSHDNGEIVSIIVSGTEAKVISAVSGVVDWDAELILPGDGKLIAFAKDRAGNVEQTAHTVNVVRRS
ncbi:MAG: G8 domain-containing protein [Pirellulaceae bacterium]